LTQLTRFSYPPAASFFFGSPANAQPIPLCPAEIYQTLRSHGQLSLSFSPPPHPLFSCPKDFSTRSVTLSFRCGFSSSRHLFECVTCGNQFHQPMTFLHFEFVTLWGFSKTKYSCATLQSGPALIFSDAGCCSASSDLNERSNPPIPLSSSPPCCFSCLALGLFSSEHHPQFFFNNSCPFSLLTACGYFVCLLSHQSH